MNEPKALDELIEALQIFRPYLDDYGYVVSCGHDIMYVNINPAEVPPEVQARLSNLGFDVDEDLENFYSHRHGSC